ncbi:UDP-N-acetylenolpyruvoylglucosamine reductase like protein, partial [Aduncisulcus paluster]
LAGIPGSVGGSIAMNAGSYGTDMQASVKRVRIWTPSKGLFWKEATELEWGYRHFSIVSESQSEDEFFLVWEVEFELSKSTEKKSGHGSKKLLKRKKQPSLSLPRQQGAFSRIRKDTARASCSTMPDSKAETSVVWAFLKCT